MRLIAHRGFHNSQIPENTLPAFVTVLSGVIVTLNSWEYGNTSLWV